MSTLRTHFTFRVDTWTPDGESIVEHVAGIEDYQVALATFRAACERWPGTPITLRQGERVIEDSRRPPARGVPRSVSSQLESTAAHLCAESVALSLDGSATVEPGQSG